MCGSELSLVMAPFYNEKAGWPDPPGSPEHYCSVILYSQSLLSVSSLDAHSAPPEKGMV